MPPLVNIMLSDGGRTKAILPIQKEANFVSWTLGYGWLWARDQTPSDRLKAWVFPFILNYFKC